MASLEPLVCVCGFYASIETNNMCSKCYKDSVLDYSFAKCSLKEESEREKTEVVETAQVVDNTQIPHNDTVVAVKPLQHNPKRCNVCKKHLLLTSTACHCGLKFCEMHRYPEEHECSYDYKTEARKALEKKLIHVPHMKFQPM